MADKEKVWLEEQAKTSQRWADKLAEEQEKEREESSKEK